MVADWLEQLGHGSRLIIINICVKTADWLEQLPCNTEYGFDPPSPLRRLLYMRDLEQVLHSQLLSSIH